MATLPSPHFRLESGVVEIMKSLYLMFVVFSLASFSAAQAQGTGAPARPPAAQTAAPVPMSKIAVVFSGEFQDAKTGIARFSALVTKLNAEFQPVQNEINQTMQRLKTLEDEITNLRRTGSATPAQIQAKIEQLDQQKKDYQRKGEDAQANYQRRRAELLMPLQQDVGKALDAFGKARGITMILDGSQVPLVYAADSIDITKSFIADYNSKNPATASATTPR